MEPFEVMTIGVAGAHAGDRRAGAPRRGAGHLPPSGRSGPRVIGDVNATGRLRVLDRPGGEVLADIPAQVARGRRPALRPAPGRAGRPRRRAAGRRRRGPPRLGRPTSAADLLGDARATPPWVGQPVRPPAVPQHRRGARRRRRRAAAEAPGHRASTPGGAWPSPPTATTAGAPSTAPEGTAHVVAEAVINLACVGARPLGAGELPQLRQPRAPRGDVAAVGGDRRHGRRLPGASASRSSAATSASTTRAGAATSTRAPVVGLLGMVDRLDRRPPRRPPRRTRAPRSSSAPQTRSLAGSRCGVGARPSRPARRRPRPRAARRRSPALVRDWSTTTASPASTTSDGWAWRSPRWPCAAGSGFDGVLSRTPTTPGSSPSPPAAWSCAARNGHADEMRAGRARPSGVPRGPIGTAGGEPPGGPRPPRRVARRRHRRVGRASSPTALGVRDVPPAPSGAGAG